MNLANSTVIGHAALIGILLTITNSAMAFERSRECSIQEWTNDRSDTVGVDFVTESNSGTHTLQFSSKCIVTHHTDFLFSLGVTCSLDSGEETKVGTQVFNQFESNIFGRTVEGTTFYVVCEGLANR